jgi:hypothetical protein
MKITIEKRINKIGGNTSALFIIMEAKGTKLEN